MVCRSMCKAGKIMGMDVPSVQTVKKNNWFMPSIWDVLHGAQLKMLKMFAQR